MKEQFLNINFEITNSCNQNCIYCYNKFNTSATGSNPIKTLQRLLKVTNLRQLTITGGEPTLSEYLLECVVHAKLQGLKVVIITNGSIANQNLFLKLIKAGVSHFQITVNSLDANIHNKLAGAEQVLENTLRTIDFIIKSGGKVIPSIVLTILNSTSLNKAFEFFYKINLKTIIINRYNLSEGEYSKKLLFPTDLLKSTFKMVDDLAAKYNLNVTSNVCTPFCILNPQDYHNIHFGTCPDNPKLKPITVDSEGNVRLCNHSPKIIGNIFKNEFSEMFYSEYALSWISNIPTYCIDCDKYEDCKGGCRAASEQLNGSHLFVDPILDYSPLSRLNHVNFEF